MLTWKICDKICLLNKNINHILTRASTLKYSCLGILEYIQLTKSELLNQFRRNIILKKKNPNIIIIALYVTIVVKTRFLLILV